MKIQIKSILGSVLFEYDCKYNTIKKTVEEAIKSYANLSYADLSYVNLSSANLRSANLRSADLRSANLSSADLSSANLSYANLRSADLRYANLSSADLRSADLRYANLSSADLRYANLSSADLRSAHIEKSYAPLLKSYFSIVPEEGSFIGWKKLSKGMIAKLEIPSNAKRTSNVKNRKCRASKVKTLDIFDKEGNEVKEGIGSHDGKTVYKVGRLTKPDSFDDDFFNDCTNGIHFFITRLEAENY